MSPFQVLWFDPGGKSGWAHVSYCADCDTPLVFNLGTLRAPQHHHGIRNLIEVYLQKRDNLGNLTVGTESFEFRKSPGSASNREGLELISREYIGIMKLVCQDHGLTLLQQSPSILSGKLVTDDHLAALGLLPPPPLQHNKDQIAATRHLIHYLLNTARIRKPIIDKYKEANV